MPETEMTAAIAGEDAPTERPASSPGSATAHGEGSTGLTTPPVEGEVTLIERGREGRRQSGSESRTQTALTRKKSADSFGSKQSFGHLSRSSKGSGRSEADRLIEAIQEPHRVEGWHEDNALRNSPSSGRHTRPGLRKRNTTTGTPIAQPSITNDADSKSLSASSLSHEPRIIKPGESAVMDQGVPIRPVRVPEDFVALSHSNHDRPASTPASLASYDPLSSPMPTEGSMTGSTGGTDTASGHDNSTNTDRMRVLVAEDDPVNSRIIKKRLEKLKHAVTLTGNGEECAGAFCDKPGFFELVLMDMQMPIVDGLTSTKMIRSYEKTHPTQQLSARAALNGRVPIIAVSASLEEKQRQHYIDAGFDGWILKPISFPRLSEIMEGIVDRQVRRENLYKPGSWERGGWFLEAQEDLFAAKTQPSNLPPQQAVADSVPVSDGLATAAASDDPAVKEENESEQSKEQTRLLEDQEQAKEEGDSSTPLAEDTSNGDESNNEKTPVATPMTEQDKKVE